MVYTGKGNLCANKKSDFHMIVQKAQKGHDGYTLRQPKSKKITQMYSHTLQNTLITV